MRTRLALRVIAPAGLLVIACVTLLTFAEDSLGGLSRTPIAQVNCSNSANGTPRYSLLVAGESWASGDRLYPDLPAELSARLGVPVRVCAMGFTGKNTRKIYRGLKKELQVAGLPILFGGHPPNMVLVLNGVNDQMQHVGAERYADDTADLAGLFPGTKVKVVSVPRIRFDDQLLPLGLRLKSRLQRLLFDHGKANPVTEYRAALAKRHPDIDVIDYDAFMPQFNEAMYRADGIHLTADGFHQYGGFLAHNAKP